MSGKVIYGQAHRCGRHTIGDAVLDGWSHAYWVIWQCDECGQHWYAEAGNNDVMVSALHAAAVVAGRGTFAAGVFIDNGGVA